MNITVTVTNDLQITEAPPSFLQAVMAKLTIENPAYLDAEKRIAIVESLNAGHVHILIATGQLIGEGFDCLCVLRAAANLRQRVYVQAS